MSITMNKSPFKRSKKAALILMVPAATLTLASCVRHPDEKEQALVYQTPEQCAQSGLSTQEQCEADYNQALALHPQTAPKYADKAQCE